MKKRENIHTKFAEITSSMHETKSFSCFKNSECTTFVWIVHFHPTRKFAQSPKRRKSIMKNDRHRSTCKAAPGGRLHLIYLETWSEVSTLPHMYTSIYCYFTYRPRFGFGFGLFLFLVCFFFFFFFKRMVLSCRESIFLSNIVLLLAIWVDSFRCILIRVENDEYVMNISFLVLLREYAESVVYRMITNK